MTIEVRVPRLPESVADATLVAWHKKPGDSVARDENLVDLETDKVVLEVPAPAAGVLKEIRLQDGTTVTSGQVLAVIEEGAVAVPGASQPAILTAAGGAAAPAKEADGADAATSREGGKLSPAARRVVEENKLDPKSVAGSGRDGRVSKSDVMNHLSKEPSAKAAPPPAVSPTTKGGQFVPAPAAVRSARGEQRVAMTRLRARIAERMVQAQSTQALLTSFNEVDLKPVNELRARYKDQFEKQNGAKLGFMSFFTKACTEALKKFPSVNASVDGNEIVYHEYFDVGVAVSTERGLIVPVLARCGPHEFCGHREVDIELCGTRACGHHHD